MTFVYCGQVVGWIKMILGTQVDIGPGHIVLDGDPARLPKGVWPKFLAHICSDQMVDGSRCHLVGLSPSEIELDEDPAPLPEKGAETSPHTPNFRPMSIVANRLDGSRLHLAWRWASVQATFC